MAKIVPYLVGGLTAFLVMDIVPVPSASEYVRTLRGSISESPVLLGTPASSINRPGKGDRGAAARSAQTPIDIATVEVVGLRDAAIVYRDRDGRELFRTDPVSNVTIVTKGLQLPEVTVRQYNGSVVKPVPVDVLHDQARDRKPPSRRERKIPIGCEPSFSPVAAPSLAHHTGRCMARLETPWTSALLDG
jgi:hypothetical protein